VKPFLLLAIRAEDAAADDEYQSLLAFAGLAERDLRRWRLERRPLGDVDLQDWSGILLGGGPFNASDPEESKSPVQRRVEADLRVLLKKVIRADFPFLGACYGIGTLGSHQGAVVDRRYAEPIGAVPVTLTRDGRRDPLLRGLPTTFDAFVGHKEAISRLPRHAALLASSPACPVQAFRIGGHVYATQFHPELDVAGLCTRIEVYKHAGYFEPGQAGALKAQARRSNVTRPPAILHRFAQRYARREPTEAGPGHSRLPGPRPSRAPIGRRSLSASPQMPAPQLCTVRGISPTRRTACTYPGCKWPSDEERHPDWHNLFNISGGICLTPDHRPQASSPPPATSRPAGPPP
jgi:GMP synthase (glutamine-hydrolysing)